jgi:hypothetical protein
MAVWAFGLAGSSRRTAPGRRRNHPRSLPGGRSLFPKGWCLVSEYPEQLIQVLELVEGGVREEQVPNELRPGVEYAASRGIELVRLVTKHGPTQPKPETSRKLARDLRPGDIIALEGRELLVEQVYIGVRSCQTGVHVTCKGCQRAWTYYPDARVAVLDEPTPQQDVWTEYVLTAEGKNALGLHRMSEQPLAASDGGEWILVSEAVARLPFIRNVKALRKYAQDHPGKLRLRPHPEHGRRHQANAADVLRLEMEHDKDQFAAMDSPTADSLPSISEANLRPLAERVHQIRAGKRK